MMEHEKVKLPKFICVWLEVRQLATSYPISLIGDIDDARDDKHNVKIWLLCNEENQWKLIDALRYGYEAEPEPRWGIKAGNCYMTNPENYGFDDVTPETAIENDAYWAIKSYADDIVKTLGFGEVVDLNKEDKADD